MHLKNISPPFVFTSLIGILISWNTTASFAQTPPQFHMETLPGKRVQASETYVFDYPDAKALDWDIFAAKPPVINDHQDRISATMEIAGYGNGKEEPDLSTYTRPVLHAIVPASTPVLKKHLAVTVTYTATVYPRQLMLGPPITPVEPLTALTREAYLATDREQDFTDKNFQNWLDINHLRKQPQDSDLDIAYRAYQFIKQHYTYKWTTQDHRASKLCGDSWSDCGGVSTLFVATMRANKIPARVLIGRSLYSGTADDTNAQCHAKSEFFAAGIGWVPIEMSGALGTPDSESPKFFGLFNGDLLVLHRGIDLTLKTAHFGTQTAGVMQGLCWWCHGEGTLTTGKITGTWTVKPLDN